MGNAGFISSTVAVSVLTAVLLPGAAAVEVTLVVAMFVLVLVVVAPHAGRGFWKRRIMTSRPDVHTPDIFSHCSSSSYDARDDSTTTSPSPRPSYYSHSLTFCAAVVVVAAALISLALAAAVVVAAVTVVVIIFLVANVIVTCLHSFKLSHGQVQTRLDRGRIRDLEQDRAGLLGR